MQAEYEKDRFRLPPSLLQIGQQEEGVKEPPKKKRKWGGSEAAANPQQQQEPDGKELVLWRVNRDEFNKRLRYSTCLTCCLHLSCLPAPVLPLKG